MPVELNHVLETLRAHEQELRAVGILHAAVFGSTARGEQKPTSDLDIVVDLKETPSIFEYAAIKEYVGNLFSNSTDVIMREALRPHVREQVEKEQVRAF